jgi:5-methylcytosine-specific restriction endonuclease McrA
MGISPEQLKTWYVDELRSYRFIMKQLGINNARKIKKMLIDAGIEIRRGSAAVATQWIGNDSRKKATGERLNQNQKVINYRKSKRPGWHCKKLSDCKLGNKNPMFGKKAVQHHNFFGGKKTWVSKRKMSREKRNQVFDSLGRICAKCGELDFFKLTINHKIPWRIVRHHELWNLEILCKKCHFSGPVKLR